MKNGRINGLTVFIFISPAFVILLGFCCDCAFA